MQLFLIVLFKLQSRLQFLEPVLSDDVGLWEGPRVYY